MIEILEFDDWIKSKTEEELKEINRNCLLEGCEYCTPDEYVCDDARKLAYFNYVKPLIPKIKNILDSIK